MSSILQKIVKTKWEEVAIAKGKRPLEGLKRDVAAASPPRDFLGALAGHARMRLIAEVKKASPSKGVIREPFDPVAIALGYQAGGAAALSVLTDVSYFQGSLDYLRKIRQVVDLPVLRKDFLVDPYQVWEAREAGADAVLLIAECLAPEMLRELYELTCELGMTALIEIHSQGNLAPVLALGPKLIGVNNRNLDTFTVDLGHVVRMRGLIPPEITLVGESGISTHGDVAYLKENHISAILVGESLMRQPDVEVAVRELLGDL